MKKVFFLLGVLVMFFVACEKDKPEPGPTTKTIAGVYKLTGLKARGGNGQQVDLYSQLNECQQNDTWDFREDGAFYYGGVVTNTCQSEDETGTWSLDGKTFTVTTAQANSSYQLESFDNKKLVLTTDGTVNGQQATYFVTFTRQ